MINAKATLRLKKSINFEDKEEGQHSMVDGW